MIIKYRSYRYFFITLLLSKVLFWFTKRKVSFSVLEINCICEHLLEKWHLCKTCTGQFPNGLCGRFQGVRDRFVLFIFFGLHLIVLLHLVAPYNRGCLQPLFWNWPFSLPVCIYLWSAEKSKFSSYAPHHKLQLNATIIVKTMIYAPKNNDFQCKR